MINRIVFVFIGFFFFSGISVGQDIRYSVPEKQWEEGFGNHRAVIEVKKAADAVHIKLLWRRHDLHPEKRRMLVINAVSGDTVRNIYRIKINNEICDIVVGPVKCGKYYFYYLSYMPVLDKPYAGNYLKPESAPEKSWVTRHNLKDKDSRYRSVGETEVITIESRTSFDSFYPMEVVATQSETKQFLEKNQDNYLIFPEDREHPIKMNDALPVRWIKEKPKKEFYGTAEKNEYYVFQLGIYASKKDIEDVSLEYSGLLNTKGDSISGSSFTCFNTGGINSCGKVFTKKVNIGHGKVQPLWIGIDLPKDIAAGTYEGSLGIKARNFEERWIKIHLTVTGQCLDDRGDGEPWRLSRLRWLNSKLGLDGKPVHPYTSLKVENRKIYCLGRSIELNDYGLPKTIGSWGHEILSLPVNFAIEQGNRVVDFPAGNFIFEEKKEGIVSWKSTSENDILKVEYTGNIEYDGRMGYKCVVTSKKDIHLQDIRLEIPLKKKYATYLIGMGQMGGLTPEKHLSRWTVNEDSFWIGSVSGGIHCELRGGSYNGPMLFVYKPSPPSVWDNAWNGGYRINTIDSTVTATAYSGYRNMKKGESVSYEFSLLVTPVKKYNIKKQFSNRYFHNTNPTKEVIANGGNIMNVHHATPYNPYINYPFLKPEKMKDLIDKWHKQGWKVKIYYTARELTTRLPELWAFRSLNSEIFSGGIGGGFSWLQEHLVNDYTVQWYNHLKGGDADAAILMSPESRGYNFYVEGVAWLIKNMDIDGLYIDEAAYDRNIIKRVRRVMDINKPGCLIDLHSNIGFSKGPLNQYAEFFPYIDKTWFGEGFNYEIMPADFWLTEISGIPMGIGNDMLLHMSDSNRRGMVFGMTQRGFPSMWKLWDDFGITTSEMSGFWNEDPAITTNYKDVYATAYIKKGKTLVVIGNWDDKPVKVRLNINWERLNLNSSEINIVAPAIEGYQEKIIFSPGELFPVPSKGDLLLEISEK